MAASPESQTLKGPGLAAALAAAVSAFTPGGQPIAAFLSTFAVSYGLQAWSMREARKRSLEDVADRKLTIRSAVAPRRVVYGEAMVSGPMVYAHVTGTDKEYLHLVIALAGHEVTGFGSMYFDDEIVGTLDGSGNVTSGTFSGLARVQFVTGTTSQSAFSDLVTDSGGKWTSAHQGKGVAALYARLKWDQDKYPGGIPQVRVLVRGKACYDPRTASSAYTMNPALVLRDYLTSSLGLGCDSAEIDDTALATAADVCDEWVALDGGVSITVTADHTAETFATSTVESRIQTGDRIVYTGATAAPTGLTNGGTYYVIRIAPSTFQLASSYANALAGTAVAITSNGTGAQSFGSIYQRRYALSGTYTTDQTPKDIMEELIASMGGTCTWTGGKWRITAGAYVAPTVTLTGDDLRGPVEFRNRTARRDLTNTVRGAYVEPARGWVTTDYAPVASSTYVTQDGDTIERTSDQAWVTNAFRAQRLAKIMLQKTRAKRLALPCKIAALPILAADTVSVTLPQLGLSAATYRVMGWTLTGEDGGIGVDLALEEESSSHYSWTASDGVAPPANAPLVLPSATTVVAPTGLAVASGTSELLAQGDGTIISRMRVSWTGAAETNLMGYELQWKRSSESTYNSVYLPRDGLQYYIGPVLDGVNYDVRVRSQASPGVRRSSWVTAVHTVVGKTAAPTAPTSIGITSLPNALQVTWTACPDADYFESEVWEATANDRATATQVATLKGNALQRSGFPAAAVRYYWVRHVDTSGNVSSWYPSGATSGVSGTAGADPGNEITHDFTGFLAGGSTAYLTGAGYWLGYSGGAYRMHLGNPSGNYFAFDGTNMIVAGALVTKAITVDSTGDIRIGTTGYLTGTGVWLGYSSGYKFHVGDPSGSHIKWDGSTLTIKGSLVTGDVQVDTSGNIRGGQTAYNTGTGWFLGYASGAYKFSIGDPSGNRLAWDGSALTVVGTINGIGQYVAGTTVTLATAATERNSASTTYTKVKEFLMPKSGTVRVGWNMKAFSGTTGYARVYVNGVAVGSEESTTSTSNVAKTSDVTVAGGDLVQLYYRNDPGSGNGTFVSSVTIKATVGDVTTVLVD